MSRSARRPAAPPAAAPRAAREPFDDLDRLSQAGLERWWLRRIRRVLEIARDELPFYRRRFEAAGFEPRALRSLADLARVPRFGKAEALAAAREAGGWRAGLEREPAGDPLVLSSSSGTKGTAFLSHPARWRRVQGVSSLRAHHWAGLRAGAPFLLSAPAWHSYAAVQTRIVESLGLPCVVVAGTYLPRFAGRIVEALLHFRPRFVTMFLPMVFSLGAEARRRGTSERELFASVDALVVAGAPVTPGMRAHLLHVTGVRRLVELAGTSENLLAVECPASPGLHVVPDTCYVEVVDRETGARVGPGERGTAVHTCVVPWGSMYLRFDGGDAATLDPAPCGCGLPSPRVKLLGRNEDAFALGGRLLLPYDVQVAVEEEIPELVGTPCVIVKNALAHERLELLVPRGDERALPARADALAERLAARFQTKASVRVVDGLPLQFKGVPPVLSTWSDAARHGA